MRENKKQVKWGTISEMGDDRLLIVPHFTVLPLCKYKAPHLHTKATTFDRQEFNTIEHTNLIGTL